MRCCSFRNGVGLAFVVGTLLPGLTAVDLNDPKPSASVTLAAQQIASIIKDLFWTGQFSAALNQANVALEANPNDAELLCLKGDILFRESRFKEAASTYESVLVVDASAAYRSRAHWGLGRLAVATSKQPKAREHFAAAFRLAPSDPDIILSYAESSADVRERLNLLRRFLQVARPSDSQRREEVAANLKLSQQLGGRQLSHVVNEDQLYQFQLRDFAPTQASLKGLRIDVRINGSGPFRMLLDSGAEGMFLSSRAARKLKLELVAEARVRGLGEKEPGGQPDPAGLMLASTLSIQGRHTGDDLQIENLLVTVMDLGWLPAIDGVIGTDVFKDFLVRIDAQSKVLELLPYADKLSSSSTEEGVAPMYRFGHRLLVRGSGGENEADGLSVSTSGDTNRSGYFMLDTGASFTLLAAQSTGNKAAGANQVSLRGAQGFLDGATPTVPIRVAIAEQQWVDAHPVSADLTAMSQEAGVEISGILGFPLLRQSILTINYRDGLVAFASNRR